MPFLIPLCGLIVGILIADRFRYPLWGLIPIFIGTAVYLTILRKSSDPLKTIRINPYHYLWIFLIFSGIGYLSFSLQKPSTVSEEEREFMHVAEAIVIDSKSRSTGDQILARVTQYSDKQGNIHEKSSFTVLINTMGFSTDPGDIIIFPARFQEIKDNPNFRSNGYPERMKRQGIYYSVQLKEGEIQIIGTNSSITSKVAEIKDKAISLVEKSSLTRETSNFVIALIFGDRTFISDETRKSFSDIGVSHILALSGLHVGILVIILSVLLYPLKLIGWHKTSICIALLLLWCFAFFTGFSPSTVRSCLMLTLGSIALLIQRQSPPMNSLIAATFLILLISPYSIYDVGLQLSVICVGCILIFPDIFNPIKQHFHPRLYSLINSVVISLVASLSSWVLISYYFETVPLLFIPANLLLLPALPFFMGAAIVYIMLLTLGVDLTCLAYTIDIFYSIFQDISRLLLSAGETTIHYRAGDSIVFCWLTGLLIAGYCVKSGWKNKKAILLLGTSFFGLSFILVFLTKDNLPDELIVQSNYRQISLVIYEDGKQYDLVMPRGAISSVTRKDIAIINIDCKADPIELGKKLKIHSGIQNRYLIISGNGHNFDLREIPEIRGFDKIILHSSVRRKMEAKLIKEAKDMGLENIYSLREEGPLKLSLEAPRARR